MGEVPDDSLLNSSSDYVSEFPPVCCHWRMQNWILKSVPGTTLLHREPIPFIVNSFSPGDSYAVRSRRIAVSVAGNIGSCSKPIRIYQ